MTMKIKEKLAAREVAGKLYIVDIEGETLHALNPSATFIWDCLKKGLSAERTVSKLSDEFEVAPDVAAKDTEEFIETLRKIGLIE